MKLSSKARYGLKAIIYLASCDGTTSLASIAGDTGLSESYLEQLFSLLKKANIIESVRGANGGYVFAKPLQDITIGAILRALEDELEMVDCISGECDDKCNCVRHKIWKTMYDAINDALDSITLESVTRGKEC